MEPLGALVPVHGSFAAHVLAARLHSEGIDVDLRGAVGGPYGLTVGDMARVDLYVPEGQIDDARLVLLASEVDDAMSPPDAAREAGRGFTWAWVAAVLMVVAAVAAPLLRFLTD
jgi:hypothetical protein